VRPKRPKGAQIESKTTFNSVAAGLKTLLDGGLPHAVKFGTLEAA